MANKEEKLKKQLEIAISALAEIANDQEESSHERAETALWSAKSALKRIAELNEA